MSVHIWIWIYPHEKRSLPHPLYKTTNTKWLKDLNERLECLKLLKGKVEQRLQDLGPGKKLLKHVIESNASPSIKVRGAGVVVEVAGDNLVLSKVQDDL